MREGLLLAALAAFAVGASAGIFLAFRHFTRKRLPAWVALLHGVGGAVGFALVLLFVVREPTVGAARQALYLFIATIALGTVNLLFHLRKKRHRTSLILVHALTAVSGVGTLVYCIITLTPASVPPAPASVPAPVSSPAPAAHASEVPPSSSVGERAESNEPRAESAKVAPSPDDSAPSPAAASELALDPAVERALSAPIGFGPSGHAILGESGPNLAEIARVLQAHPEITRIQIQGHADSRGSDARNVELSLRRARAVSAALSALGVDAGRLEVAGYGSRCPADPSCEGRESSAECLDAAHLAADRRVVLLVLEAGGRAFRGAVTCEAGAPLIPSAHRRFHGPP